MYAKKLIRSIRDLNPGHVWYAEAESWYNKALLTCYEIKRQHDLVNQKDKPIECFVTALAALSPRKTWQQNVQQLIYLSRGQKVGHFGKQVAMAQSCFQSGFAGLTGRKIVSFALNILGDEYSVTVDTIVMQAAGLPAGHKPGDTQYDDVADAVIHTTDWWNRKHKTNASPRTIQSLIWIAYRGTHV
jgi:hypothetical protein